MSRILHVGDRVYYTGDAANAPDWGTVVREHTPDRFTPAGTVDIRCDDGRMWRHISPVFWAPSLGRRFEPEDEHYKARVCALLRNAESLAGRGQITTAEHWFEAACDLAAKVGLPEPEYMNGGAFYREGE